MTQLTTRTIPVDQYGKSGGRYISTLAAGVSPPIDSSIDGPNNFIIDNSTVYNFNMTPIQGLSKGQSHIDPITGASIRRMTAAGDLSQTTAGINGYSRWPQENCDNTRFINYSTNSYSSSVQLTIDCSVITEPAWDGSGIASHAIGMIHEPRWHPTDPDIFYYLRGNVLYRYDVTLTPAQNAGVIQHDFNNDIVWPAAASGQIQKVYTDQEGNMSNDGNHIALMAVYYDGSTYAVVAFIHHQLSPSVTHVMYPADDGIPSDASRDTFQNRPNTIEMVPDGSAVLIHSNRAYTGWIDNYDQTAFDGPHIWPVDFNIDTGNGGFLPKKVSVSSTHSGWGWDDQGRPLFFSQDNRNDTFGYVVAVLDPGVLGYGLQESAGAGWVEMIDHAYFGYGVGFHAVSMPPTHAGWIFVSTYGVSGAWSGDQILAFKMEPRGANPTSKCWRVSPQPNVWIDQYFDESAASINMTGNRISTCGNAGINGDPQFMYFIDLPANYIALAEAAS